MTHLQRDHGDICIVGIGASAGGLAALEAFFTALSPETQQAVAIVVVQHLAPGHKSILSELIGRHTAMSVEEATDGARVEPGCVYVIPPNSDLTIVHGVLRIATPSRGGRPRLAIDAFFRSLAQDQGERCIGVILSGTGSDGSLGARAIKDAGGVLMVQDPESTEFDGMPRSAIATGLVDWVLAPEDMPAQLASWLEQPLRGGSSPSGVRTSLLEVLDEVCDVLLDGTGHDFSSYKTNTVVRRVQRRMAVHRLEEPADYLHLLRQEPAEVDALFQDLLIGVTRFFRDPDAFAALERLVIPRLCEAIPRRTREEPTGDTLKIWIAGCSTGEEAYSLGMLVTEHLALLKRRVDVQIFATDIDRRAIEQARRGVFAASIADDVSPERLDRFFTQDADTGEFRVCRSLRDLIIFSEQDLIRDPPFSRLDLISCRNVLIYLNAETQARLISVFHYALRPHGVLFLGASETVGKSKSLFSVLDQASKIHERMPDLPGTAMSPLRDYRAPRPRGGGRRPTARPPGATAGVDDLQGLAEAALLQHYAQVGVLVDGRGEILHLYGRAGRYLEPAPGDASLNVLAMARNGLRRAVTSALHRAVTHGEVASRPRQRLRAEGRDITVGVTVRPVLDASGEARRDLFLVVFEEEPAAPEPAPAAIPEGAGELPTDPRLTELERDLRAKEEYLEAALEELQTSNDDLRSALEEMQSMNEELQSTNEELETSQEEMQSVNEELATVNAELQAKATDSARANNDLNNLMAGTGIATLFVDHKMLIRRYTPTATQLINLIPGDVGRPVGHVVSNLVSYDRLVQDTQSVLDTLVPVEAEVQTGNGAWYLMRIRPYRTLDNVIEGAVITFVDISRAKAEELAARDAEGLAQSIVASVREPLLVLDGGMRIQLANAAFHRTFQTTREQIEGRDLFALNDGRWDTPALRGLLEDILPQHGSFEDHDVTLSSGAAGTRTFRLNARTVRRERTRDELILLAFEHLDGPGLRPGRDATDEEAPR